MMDLNLLATLVAVAESGGLTAAGRRLGLSQPAVHHQLARLSEAAGRPLYRREGRTLVLTAAGRRLVALGRSVARASEVALAELRGAGEPRPVIAAGRGTWRDRVRALPACRPRVCDGERALDAVREGEAQLGVAAVPPPDDLESCVVARAETCVGVPTGHALRGDVAWAELVDETWVLPPRGRPLRDAVEAHVPDLRVAVEVEGWDVLQRFVALGAGITVVNTGVAPVEGVRTLPMRDALPVVYRAFWREDVDAEPWVRVMFPDSENA